MCMCMWGGGGGHSITGATYCDAFKKFQKTKKKKSLKAEKDYLIRTQILNVIIFLVLQWLRRELVSGRGHVVRFALGSRLLREGPVQFFIRDFVVSSEEENKGGDHFTQFYT